MKKISSITLALPLLIAIGVLTSSHVQAIQFELGASMTTTIISASESNPADPTKTGPVALMARKASWGPFFALVGTETYFSKETNFGWTYQVWASPFESNTQEIDGDFEDIDTGLNGRYFYFLPMIYYRFGDRFATKPKKHWRITLGMGYGISYGDINGNIKLTKSSSETNARIKSVSTNSFHISFGVLLKLSWNKAFISASNSVPQIYDDEHIYRVSNISYSIGYEFELDMEIGSTTKTKTSPKKENTSNKENKPKKSRRIIRR